MLYVTWCSKGAPLCYLISKPSYLAQNKIISGRQRPPPPLLPRLVVNKIRGECEVNEYNRASLRPIGHHADADTELTEAPNSR
jgi:hypothetical protein